MRDALREVLCYLSGGDDMKARRCSIEVTYTMWALCGHLVEAGILGARL